jgi:hypothetical protein
MTRGIRQPIALFFAAVLCAHAQEAERQVSTPLPRYEIQRVSAAITIDGRLDDAAWKSAATVTLQFPWEAQTGAKQKTTVRLLWDDEYLYAAFACEDADIVAHHEKRDDPTYRDDAVELFINPSPKQNVYYGLEMNARAVLYDYLNIFSQALVKYYDLRGVKLASHLAGTLNVTSDTDRGWDLEVAIPLANFAELMGGRPVVNGTEWTANLNRWDGTEPNRRLSLWSDSAMPRPNPHNPKRFGQLVFVK